jgi:hypothetical protein
LRKRFAQSQLGGAQIRAPLQKCGGQIRREGGRWVIGHGGVLLIYSPGRAVEQHSQRVSQLGPSFDQVRPTPC